jgi:hypothetical protein
MDGLWSHYLFLRARSSWKAGMIILIYPSFRQLFLPRDILIMSLLLDGFKNSMRQQRIE